MGLLLTRRSCAVRWSCWLSIHRPRPLPKPLFPERPPLNPGIRLTWLSTQVGVKALRLEHDEQRAPAQEDCREEEVFHHGRAGHPPAAPMGSGQGGRHGEARRGAARRDAATRLRLGLLSAATCARTSALAPGPTQPRRPTRAAAAARAASHPLRSAGDKCAQQGSPSPASALGHPLRRWLIRQPAAPGEAAPARQEDFSLGSLGGKLRHRNTK